VGIGAFDPVASGHPEYRTVAALDLRNLLMTYRSWPRHTECQAVTYLAASTVVSQGPPEPVESSTDAGDVPAGNPTAASLLRHLVNLPNCNACLCGSAPRGSPLLSAPGYPDRLGTRSMPGPRTTDGAAAVREGRPHGAGPSDAGALLAVDQQPIAGRHYCDPVNRTVSHRVEGRF
jgi:hypothetical protein